MVYSNPRYSTVQCTLNQVIDYVGIGLHGGRNVAMQLHPAAPNSGINFFRRDVPRAHALVPAAGALLRQPGQVPQPQ